MVIVEIIASFLAGFFLSAILAEKSEDRAYHLGKMSGTWVMAQAVKIYCKDNKVNMTEDEIEKIAEIISKSIEEKIQR